MKIKTGDSVTIISGKDKGKTAKVLRAFPREDKVLVEGINMKKRHERTRKQGGKGQIIDKPHPVHISNVKKA
jgi:large subunit ribosomal protein L24